MRCQKAMTRECPSSAICELQGCQQPYGPPKTALVKEREPIDLPALEDYQPGRLMRGLMRLTDRGEAAVRRGPTPFAAAQPPPETPPMSQSTTMSIQPPPAPPSPAAPAADLRITQIVGGWIVYAGDRPVAVAADPAALGATVAGLVKR